MKAKINIIIILCTLIVVCTFVGCKKYNYSCSCMKDYPEMYDHYAPDKYVVSWTYFNPMIKVQEYFYHHDSTLNAHDGDTILLFGKVPGGIDAPRVGQQYFLLNYEKEHYEWGDCMKEACFPCVDIKMPEGRVVEEWMTEKSRVVFVKGIIRNLGYDTRMTGVAGDDVRLRIDAIQIDSVKF
ncbi:MAG: hypothetical protein IKP21_06760 [Bacteroidales bacterium]|nr:hypothetical protein [Bacteroidales bacterium]